MRCITLTRLSAACGHVARFLRVICHKDSVVAAVLLYQGCVLHAVGFLVPVLTQVIMQRAVLWHAVLLLPCCAASHLSGTG
jgi:hypothetical protein